MAVVSRIKPDQLKNRLDSVFYHPDFINNEKRLQDSSIPSKRLKELVHKGRRAVYFSTSTLETGEAPNTWVPFLTADDMGDSGFFIDLQARRWVSPDFAAKYPNGLLRANELLVKVKGPNQITAYNPQEPEYPVLVSGTIWGGIVRNDQVDPYYLTTALSSFYAFTARSRLRTNTNVEFLSPNDLLEVELPITENQKAQTYIGDKVRQAERLRKHAQDLKRRTTRAFENAIKWSTEFEKRTPDSLLKKWTFDASLCPGSGYTDNLGWADSGT